MRSKKCTIRTFSQTINELCVYYDTQDVSLAFRCCVQDCILQQVLFTKNKRRITPAQTLKVVTKNKKSTHTNTRVSIRLPMQAVDFLQNYYNAQSVTDTLHCCIYDVLNHVAFYFSLKGTDKVIYMVGQKNVGMQDFLNKSFDDIRSIYRIDGYAEPFCGTANVLLHTTEADAEFLNDNSLDLVNLLRVLQKYPYELRLNLLLTPLNKGIFDEYKKLLEQPFSLKAKKSEQITRATAFYFCRYTSVFGKGESFKNNTSIDGFRRRLDTIYPLSLRLQDVDIKKRDALYFAGNLCEDAENFLIYFDAPYLCSEEHYKVNNRKRTAFSSHTALRNRVAKLRQKNICLLSYRITASDSMKKKGIEDADLQNILDKLYLNRGFWYRLKKFDNKKEQIEILISTVPFCGAKPYTTPMSEVEVM